MLQTCSSDTLSNYSNNLTFPSGCAIGILDYSTFSYHPISNAPLASDIVVTPSGQGFDFTQAGNKPFIANTGQIVQFEIDYNILIDPAPLIGGARLRLDPPSGDVSITEFFCNDGQYFFSGRCFGSPVNTLKVGTIPPLSLTNSIAFPDPAQRFQEVGILFTLDGTNGPSSFDGLEADSSVIYPTPEPEVALISGFLFSALLAVYRLKRRGNA